MYSAFSWFISVFVVGILINVISAYAMPYFDRYISQFSDYQRISNEKRKAEIDKKVNRMLEDHDYYIYVLSNKQLHQIEGYLSLIFISIGLFIPSMMLESYNFVDLVSTEIDKLEYGKRVFQFIFYSMHPIRFPMLLTWLLWIFILFSMLLFLFSISLNIRNDTTILREYFKRKPERNHPINIE